MLERDPVQKLHGNERLLAVFADFVDGANIGMIESGRRTRLPAKAFQGLRVPRQVIGQEFEGDEAAKVGVFSFVNHPHAAPAELLDDAVVRDGLVDHKKMPSLTEPHLTDAVAASQRIARLGLSLASSLRIRSRPYEQTI